MELHQGWYITIQDQAKYPRLVLKDVERNWSSAASLGLDLYVYGHEPLDMTVILDDAPGVQTHESRFQQTVQLAPGSNAERFAKSMVGFKTSGRSMALQNVSGLGLYFSQRDAGRNLKLSKIFLDPEQK